MSRPSRKGQGDPDDDDPFMIRPNAPISVIKAAKASLKQPTRPETPADLGRQLFTRESEFAQNRPPSAYGVPSSKQFFESGPKLSIAKLDAYSRADGAGTGSTLAAGRRSILENSPDQRFSRISGTRAPHEADLSFSGPGGRPTAAATVAAIKASMAAGSKAYLHPDVEEEDTGPTLDPRRNDDLPPRPNTSRGRPGSSGLGEGMSTSSRPPPMPTTVDTNGAQVLDMSQAAPYSDSESDSGDEHGGYHGMYRHEQDSAVHTPMAREVGGGSHQPAGAAAAASSHQQVVHDASDAFFSWRSDTEAALHQLAAATGALAAAQQAAVAAGSAGPAVREAMQTLMKHCDVIVKLVELMRKQPKSSQWLNSSSDSYADTEGRPLSMREAISEHVFRLMDSSNTELMMKATAVVLRVVKNRNPLLQAGKLLYRLSKDSANDMLFKRECLLEPMLRTIHIMVASTAASVGTRSRPSSASAPQGAPTTSSLHEPLVYYCGALKNCSNDTTNQRSLVKAGALRVLCSALSTMASQVQLPETQASEEGRGSSSGDAGTGATLAASGTTSLGAAQVAVQITGVLRNLAVAPAHAPGFVAGGALPALRAAASVLPGQQELVLNVGRVLSKLSLSDACVGALEGDREFCSLLVSLLSRHARHRPLLLRLAFVLGNLTTNSNSYRQQVAAIPGALDMLISTLHLYANPSSHATDAGGASGRPGTASGKGSHERLNRATSREDCAVKLLRLIANLAIHPEVGLQLASSAELASALQAVLESTSFGDGGEELVLNAVCAMTNLSFYQRPENKVLAMGASTLLKHVTPLLLCDNEEAIVEAARAFGNFSRTADARAYMVGARVLEALVLLLDHSSTEVLYSVCGTLINFSADSSRKRELVALAAPGRLVDVLERCLACEEPGDMEVGTLSVVCKALFNLCADEPGGKSGSGSSEGTAGISGLSTEQLEALVAVLQGVQECEELMAHAEVPQVTARLLSVVQRILSH